MVLCDHDGLKIRAGHIIELVSDNIISDCWVRSGIVLNNNYEMNSLLLEMHLKNYPEDFKIIGMGAV